MDPIVLLPISLLFLVCMILGRNESVRREVVCPESGATARVELLRRSLRPSKLVKVRFCSLLPDPRKVTCGQECLKCPVPLSG